jgi:drug/metabolite transporter (DMT)-like permease
MPHSFSARQEVGLGLGVLIAIVSSALGGTAAAVTRYLVGDADALTLAILRWGIGFVCVLPVALFLRVRWPARRDWPAVAALGVSFFGLFFILYNVAVAYTTAARASLALSTLPLQTMLVGALLRAEPLTVRKSAGVGIAMLGVFAALASGLSAAPPGAWRGELIMVGAALCMAFYNVLSRPLMQRSSALGFLTVGMGCGAAVLLIVGIASNRISVLSGFEDCRCLPRNRRRSAGIHSLGARARASNADARGEYHDGQSDCRRAARHLARRRADHHKPDRGPPRGIPWYLDRDDREPHDRSQARRARKRCRCAAAAVMGADIFLELLDCPCDCLRKQVISVRIQS